MYDKLNDPLIQLLGKDASQSGDVLAKKLGVSAATVRRRIRKLAKEETIRIIAVLDPEKVGLDVGAFLFLEVDQDKLDSVMDKLSSLREIKWVSSNTGKSNLTAFVRTHSNIELAEFLKSELPKLDGVNGCETKVCLEVRKGRYTHV